MKWKRIFVKSWGGKRRLQCHLATHHRFTFEIVPRGGHTMVKHWWLHITKGFAEQPLFSACFFKLADAKDFAESLTSGGKASISLVNLAGIYS